jgi:SPP1 family predicted phage head-tail adaptor
MTVWGSVEPLTGRELLLAQQVSAEVTIRVTIRYDSGNTVTPQHRIIIGSRTLEIVYVGNPEERDKQLILMCKEIV